MKHARFLLLIVLVCLAAWVQKAFASIVINEVMWMGSDLSTADEWVELVGVGDGSGSGDSIIDMSGWQLTTRASSGEEKVIIKFASGTTIGSGEYLLISNYGADQSRLSIAPDLVTTAMSLSNTKLLLRLYDGSGTLIDEVDDGIGVPFAGINASGTGMRASMERISFKMPGNQKDNWRTAETYQGFDDGAPLLGTPSFPNGTGSSRIVTGSGSTSSGSTGSGATIDPSTGSGSTGSGSTETGSGSGIDPNPNPTSIFITEVLANPIGKDDHEWIEIGNLGSGSVNIAGWILDEGNSPDNFLILPESASGFILEAGEHVSFRKSVTGLPLDNKGEQLSLFSGSILIDSWEYPETSEHVSYGRSMSGSTFQPFCVPTEGAQNQDHPLDVTIRIQSHNGADSGSGRVVGEGKLSLNLEAVSASGSLASAVCHWEYSDGFTSGSCNPPSHSFKDVGTHQIVLTVDTYCERIISQSLEVEVLPKSTSAGGGGGGGSRIQPEVLCVPTDFLGVKISEFLPNPYGEEKEGEWIELFNETSQTIGLCGWSIDDSEDGSKPYSLDGESILPNEYLLLPRFQTNIALNNNEDHVRLFAPSEQILEDVFYQKSIEGESYALRSDGNFVWTPFITPERQNEFRSAERRFPTDRAVVSAALPNPVGKDTDGEWIEIANVSDEVMNLTGWSIDNKEGGSPPFLLNGVIIIPNEVRRFPIGETGINLVNTQDTVRLLDPDKYTVSIFGWTEAVEGRIYRRPVIVTDRAKAKVVNVVDGDTVDIILTDPDQFARIPPSLKRRWLGLQVRDDPSIRVRMLGIDTPESVHPSKAVEAFGIQASEFSKALLDGKNVELEFDHEIWDKYDRLLAYVYIEGGESAQSALLRNGLAYAYLRFPFLRREEFIALEAEARSAKLGMWSDGEVEELIDDEKDELEEEKLLEEEGLTLSVDPPSGLVASGTLITFTPSVSADLFLSVNSGTFVSFSGSYLVTENVRLNVYAERIPNPNPNPNPVGTGSLLRSKALEVAYILEQKSYSNSVIISEVYPSPQSGEEEWIELFNFSSEDIPLAGWILDDIREGGSKPWVIPGDKIIPGSGYLLLTQAETGISFNNDGDEVWLVSPGESIQVGEAYGKVKKGKSLVTMTDDFCITDVPTPSKKNICIEFLPAKDAPDEDRDFLPDDREQILYSTNTTNPDSDGDRFFDGFEVKMGMNPMVPDEESREILLEYKDFILGSMKPKWTLYKRKGLVIKGKEFPVESVGLAINPIGVSYQASIDENGAWEIIIPPPLDAGSYRIDIMIKDIVGREMILGNALKIGLEERYEKKSTKKRASKKISKLRVKYKNLIPWLVDGTGSIMQIPDSHSYLASFLEVDSSKIFSKNPSGNEGNLPLEVGLFFLFCFSCVLLLLRPIFFYKAFPSRREGIKGRGSTFHYD